VYDLWPRGDGPNERHARLITTMAMAYTIGFVLWIKLLFWVLRGICGC
jgi:hypothetical protein